MAASGTFKISDDVRDVLARSTITATTVKLPDGQLERKLYEQVNKALAGAGGKWNRKAGAHVFDRDPREALGMAVETGKAVNLRTASQAFYTPPMLADRVVAHANLRPGMRVLEPSIGEGALVLAAVRAVGPELIINGYDTDEVACERARARVPQAAVSCQSFLTVAPCGIFDAVIMNPPFTGGQDMAHVTHAWGFVKPGGRLVAITWPAWQTARTKAALAFRGLLAATEHEVEDIEPGTFEHTGVATLLLVMRKPGL